MKAVFGRLITVLVIATSSILFGCQESEAPVPTTNFRLIVNDYGQYQRVASDSEDWTGDAELLLQRRKLALEAQISIGFRYTLHADDVLEPVKLTLAVKPPSNEQGLTSLKKTLMVKADEFPYQGQFFHTLEDADNLLPGTWILYLKANGKLLSRQPFQLLPTEQP
ncbi:hypothetical protein ACFSJ3_08770 [Corallincola platygyrae]|uniref:DUF3859 domain-containing protein n=1 Tax=Corallincola platygyrae TaxID=1193278 RepID=A0ABW4XKI5_9GAMM